MKKNRYLKNAIQCTNHLLTLIYLQLSEQDYHNYVVQMLLLVACYLLVS